MSKKAKTTATNKEANERNEEKPILYDRRAIQKIPLLSVDGNRQSRCWHFLKPLSNERYFQLEQEVEEVINEKRNELRKIYKPYFDLWQELFIEREGLKEKDFDVLFTEAVQAIKALIYYESAPLTQSTDNENFDFDADDEVYFGAMFSGAWLGLQIYFQNQLSGKIDAYQETQKKTGTHIWNAQNRSKAEKLHELVLPFTTKANGYAEADSLIDVVPAWHITKAADELFSSSLLVLTSKPVITGVYGQ